MVLLSHFSDKVVIFYGNSARCFWWGVESVTFLPNISEIPRKLVKSRSRCKRVGYSVSITFFSDSSSLNGQNAIPQWKVSQHTSSFHLTKIQRGTMQPLLILKRPLILHEIKLKSIILQSICTIAGDHI